MKLLLPCAVVAAVCWIIAPMTQAQNTPSAQNNPMDKFVLDGKEAIIVLPPELIAAPTIKNVYVSPDGNNLIVLRETMKITPESILNVAGSPPKLPDGMQELIYWNARTRTARSFWTSPLFAADVREVVWLPQTEIAFVVLQSTPLPNHSPDALPFKPEWKLLKMTAGQIRATELPLPDLGQDGSVSVSASATLPLAMLDITQEIGVPPRPDGGNAHKTSLYLIRRDGRVDAPLALPNHDKAIYISPTWDKDGKPVIYHVNESAEVKDRKVLHYAVDLKTLASTLIEGKFEGQDKTEPDRTRAGVLTLKPQKVMANINETQKQISTLWLVSNVESKFPRLLLAGDAAEGRLIQKGNGALYQSQSALWYTPFLRLNQAQFLAARKAALKQTAMSNARQAGTALYMYVQDYDEMLPDPDGIKDKVMPYLRNEEIMEGFVYTHEGGAYKSIKELAETVVGYVPGPGGRANIYADGHVRWADDPEP